MTDEFDGGPEPSDVPSIEPVRDDHEAQLTKRWDEAAAKAYLRQRTNTLNESVGAPIGVDLAMTPGELGAIAPGLHAATQKWPALQVWLERDKVGFAIAGTYGYVRGRLALIRAVRAQRRAQQLAARSGQQERPAPRTAAGPFNPTHAVSIGAVPNAEES